MPENLRFYFNTRSGIGHFPGGLQTSAGGALLEFMRKNYIFTTKRHSNRAIMATILGSISLVSLGIVLFMSYRSAGEAAVGFGFTGFLATVFSLIGLGLGIATVRDKNYYRLFPVLGMVVNLAALGGISLILYAGANM